jgi:hypothetical protein
MYNGSMQRNAHLKHPMFSLRAHKGGDLQWMYAAKYSLKAADMSFKVS